MLSRQHLSVLGLLAQDERTMEALKSLADELTSEAAGNMKPPMALDEYGLNAGAAHWLSQFVSRIESADMVLEANYPSRAGQED